MNAMRESFLREQLIQRRERLQTALAEYNEAKEIVHLIDEIDGALNRMSNGSFGMCEECEFPIEEDRLMADPLLRYCLDHLTNDQRRALEHDIQLANIIQTQLLPKLPVDVKGWDIQYYYQPALAISGDYCDILSDQESGVTYFIIGDVSGKGIAASMMMTHLHALFRSLIIQKLPLEHMMEQANRVFSDSTMASFFATLVSGKLTSDGTVEICIAGHCPPILLRKNGIVTLQATGIPLGIFNQTSYTTIRETLTTGDSIVLYSDGISEEKNPENDEFGDARLTAFVENQYGQPAEMIITNCMNELKTFRGSAQQQDDITLMVIQRTE
jgi:phosphoserine phosphatase RsbU/P